MNRLVKILLAVVVVAGLAFGGWKVFEHFDHAGVIKDSERSCGTLDTPDPTAALPPGITVPPGLKLLRVVTQGKTILVVTSRDGVRKDVVTVRDEIVQELAALGFTKKGQDQEPGYEAEAQLSGTANASLRVRPLCTNRLEVRLTIRR